MMPPDSTTSPVASEVPVARVDDQGHGRRADCRHHGVDGGGRGHPAHARARWSARRSGRPAWAMGSAGVAVGVRWWWPSPARRRPGPGSAGGGAAHDPGSGAVLGARSGRAPGAPGGSTRRPGRRTPRDAATGDRRAGSTPAVPSPSTSSPQSSPGSCPDAPWSSPSTGLRLVTTGRFGASGAGSDDRRRRFPAAPPRPATTWPYDDQVARDLAIDLGTANTLVYAKGRGIVLNQPTVIALNTRTHEVLAVGNEAWQMIGRTPGYIVAVRPLREGAITDFDITERMIRLLLRRAGVTRLNRPRVLICVPFGHHLGGAAGGQGGGAAGRRLGRPSDRAAHGRGHRGRAWTSTSRWATWWSTSAAAPPRPRSSRSAAWWPPTPSGAAASTWTPPSRTTYASSTASPSASAPARSSSWPSARPCPMRTRSRRRCGAARSPAGCPRPWSSPPRRSATPCATRSS